MTAHPYADAAKRYTQAGWAPLPLGDQPGAKTPPPRGFTGTTGTDPTPEQVNEWVTTRGDRNIGIRLPVGIVGIDVDDYNGKAGADTMKATANRHGRLPRTWVSTSRDGLSGIRWFQTPPGIMPGKLVHPDNDDLSGVEVIQHSHRYAVVPPSIHPEGRPYRWISPDGEAVDDIPAPSDLPELPAAWVDHIRKECSCFATVYDWTRYQATDRKDPVNDTFDRWSARLNDSYGRHDAATAGVMALVAFKQKGWPGASEALERLEAQFYAALGDSRSQREAEAEWQRMVDGAETKAVSTTIPTYRASPLASVTALAPDADIAYTAEDPRVVEELERLRIRETARRLHSIESRAPIDLPEILTLAERLKRPVRETTWRIEGWQPAGSRVVLTAQFKAGKTTLTGNLARSLVDGAWWLDQAAPKTVNGTVVIIDFEMGERQIDEWLKDQGIINAEQVVIIPMRGKSSAFDIIDPGIRHAWVERIRNAGGEYVIVDCLRPLLDALGLDEHRDAGRFLVAFDALLDEASVPDALLVHHMGHTSERARGDSRIRDWPDVEWRLVRQGDDPNSPRFITAFGRDVDVPEAGLRFDQSTRRLSLVPGSRSVAEARETIPAILEFLESAGTSSKAAIEMHMRDHSDVTKTTARKALTLAIHDGLIEVTRGARGALLHSINPSSSPARRTSPPARQRGPHDLASSPIESGEVVDDLDESDFGVQLASDLPDNIT